jgi:hypothetical protein
VIAGYIRCDIFSLRPPWVRWFLSFTNRHLTANRGEGWKHRYARQGWINPLKSYAYPVIGDLALDDITYAHVVAAMQAAEAGKTKRPQKRGSTPARRTAGARFFATGRATSATFHEN